jgi:hypothetical protein
MSTKTRNITYQRQPPRCRTARFTFTLQKCFELDKTQLKGFAVGLGLTSTRSLKGLAKKVTLGTRGLETEAGYIELDRILLPRIDLNIFFSNFSNPQKIFCNPEDFLFSADTRHQPLIGARITYFGVWESHQEDKNCSVELAIDASFLFEIQSKVDIENTEKIKDISIQRQILECRNMFNFFVRNFEYDDDDILENDWVASYI